VEKIKRFLIANKKDAIYMSCLFLVFMISALIIGRIYGELFIDCGREAYLPQAMLQGKVLFKDIFGMYNPLSYQINAVLYFIFGANFNTLYLASYINAILMLFGMYFISRIFINQFYSFVFCITVMAIYVFGNIWVISYIYPYSFAMIYATTAFVYSVLLFLYYMKTNNKKLLFSSFLLYGVSFANKPEYLLPIVPMIIVMFLRKENVKSFIISIASFLAPELFSFLILAIQGFRFDDLVNYLNFCRAFFSTEEQMFYTSKILAQPWSIYKIKACFQDFGMLFIYIFVGCLYFCLFYRDKLTRIAGILFIPAFFTFTREHIYITEGTNPFSWVIIASLIILYLKVEKINDVKDKLYIFLIIVGILSTARINFLLNSKFSYGIYCLLPILVAWIFFVSTNFKILERFKYKQYTALALLALAFMYLYNVEFSYSPSRTKLETAKGTIYPDTHNTKLFKKMIVWVDKNTSPNDSVLVIPEGIMLNYVTGRPTKLKYYHLIPNHIAALGEKNIVKGLKKDKPDYIIVNNIEYAMYGKSLICKDFGQRICKFINDNYELVNTCKHKMQANKYLEADIYKLKKNRP